MSALYLSGRGGRIEARGRTHYSLRNTQTYSEWDWDGERLHARVCALGVHPVFWRARPHGVALATSPLELLEEGFELDYPALAVFLRLGFFIGEDTPFAGVKQLAPGSVLRWDAERGVRVEDGGLPYNPPCTLERTQAMDRYAALLRAAVERCLPLEGRLCVPLSGGRDSRHIALALHALGVRPQAYVTLMHLPGRPDEDARIATLLAAALGTPHVVLPQPRFYVRNILRNLRECAMCADEHAQLPPLTDWLRANADVVFDGIGGDVMSAGLFQSAEVHEWYRRGELKRVAARLFHDWRSSVRGWQHAVDDDLARRLSDEIATERLLVELERHRGHHNPLRSFYFWNRTRREIALQPFALFQGLRVDTPYLDEAVWNFLDSLPFELVGDQRFHTDTILRAYPEFAHIPFETKGARRHMGPVQRMLLGASLAPSLIRYGAWRRPPLMLRWLRLLAGVRIWWNPNMLLYMLALMRMNERALPRHAPQGRYA
ncbi:MAG: asparagine synthase C-terminal domain-containing protein [Pseudomonadota bacterium]